MTTWIVIIDEVHRVTQKVEAETMWDAIEIAENTEGYVTNREWVGMSEDLRAGVVSVERGE